MVSISIIYLQEFWRGWGRCSSFSELQNLQVRDSEEADGWVPPAQILILLVSGLRVCISNKCAGAAGAAGPQSLFGAEASSDVDALAVPWDSEGRVQGARKSNARGLKSNRPG